MVAKQILAFLNILIVNSLQHLVNAIVCRLLVALDVNPQSAVGAIYCGPNAKAAEEVVAVQLTAVGAVILMPLEVELTHVI